MEIETVPWDTLKPHHRNARNGDVDAIVASVRANGVYRPVITASDGTILAGHHLWYALGELRRKQVDIVRLPLDPDGPEALRLMVADNRTSDLGRYDEGLLVELLGIVERADGGLDGTGYSDEDLQALIDLEKRRYEDWENREERSRPDPMFASEGRRWRLGDHILVCGDSSDLSSWDGAPEFAACVTDPPYGIGAEGNINIKREMIANDQDGAAAADIIGKVFTAMPLADGAVCYTFGAVGPDGIIVAAKLLELGVARWMLVWVKNNFQFSRADYHPKHEVVWYGWKEGAHLPVLDRTRSTVLEFARERSVDLHPTQKPVPLVEHLLKGHDFPVGATVVDPFGGSGTTMMACENLGLQSWTVELDPSYCETIISRWESETGKVAVAL